jgi:hypothetical protein
MMQMFMMAICQVLPLFLFAAMNALTRRRSFRRVIPTSVTSTHILPAAATTRRRSSRRVIPTSSSSTPIPAAAAAAAATTRPRSSRRVIPLPSTAAVNISTSRRSRRQTSALTNRNTTR